MGRLTARLLRLFGEWDRVSVLALTITLALLTVVLSIAAFGPSKLRQPAIIGTIGLAIMIQVVFMWGNRGMVAPFKKAQNAFVEGDFEMTCALLEQLRTTGKANIQALTLLGNAYRQLGMLDESETVLREALEIQPLHYFPLYGFGRTLLAKGNYEEAAVAISQALEAGAPPVIQFDLGNIRYRQGLMDEARQLLEATRPLIDEPYRALMADYLLFRLGVGNSPTRELINSGLPFWCASSEQCSHTAYGEALIQDIQQLQALLKEN
jgi:tetratricopeptide (TPR) repeat protein